MTVICSIKNIHYAVRERVLFDIEDLEIRKEDRIGLVGKNGSGKSTLLHLISGQLQQEEGEIFRNGRITLLPQLKNTDTVQSGGEVTQAYINQAFAESPDLLLADEPTTNLDVERVKTLEQHLTRFQGSMILVSHDRTFLDLLCTKIWEIEDGRLKEYKGNYQDYADHKQLEFRQQEAAHEQFLRKKKQLESAIEEKEKRAKRATVKPTDGTASSAKNAKPYFAKKQKKLRQTAKALETRLDQMEKIERPKEAAPIKMTLPNESDMKGRPIIRFEEQVVSAGDKELFALKPFYLKGGQKTALIGGNGTGKTTLIKSILATHEGITVSPSVRFGYFSQNLDILKLDKTILENVMEDAIQTEDIVRTILARLHFYRDDVFKPVHVLSGGERVKVAFAKIFVSNLNVLIMDEPTNFLDIQAVEALEGLLKEYRGTVLFITHDRKMVTKIADRVLEIKNGKLTVFDGDFKSYREHKPKEHDETADELLKVETKITEVLSRLSITPSEELDQEFQMLLQKKQRLLAK
ncbi:ribosomal protection-like ABC-F family protein [Jeotgalibacillus terrae]|uniref:Ribosomal protection-like ABC-F family protein n=1 Tax=Jeotgalibacillus terrae TaxID=587735 RepID=A0ABW5ZF97_9BACL|nr:ABC-F type ribosomal protection protein [Jeotgalibacillus terrae]MBM7579592.1 pleuromutilin/lincosamide/streptogramin A transport system ATP-binding/permease protein [Jeotgalibacillus terrae]